jgi:ankyrin repeat protein
LILEYVEPAYTQRGYVYRNDPEDTLYSILILFDAVPFSKLYERRPGAQDMYGRTPLWWAAGKGREAVVRLLDEKGADLESKASRAGGKRVCECWRGREDYDTSHFTVSNIS